MIKFEAVDRVGEITIARAATGNAFTADMVRQLRDAFDGAALSTATF